MNKLPLLVIMAIAGLGLWYFSANKPFLKPGTLPFTTTQETVSPSPRTKTPTEITIQLNKEGDFGQSGTAVFKSVNGKVMVIIDLTGTLKGVVQPAHIHEGLCPGIDATKYSLTSLIGGKSETTLNVSLEKFLSQLPLAVNIHKSVAEAGEYVSCGNLIAK